MGLSVISLFWGVSPSLADLGTIFSSSFSVGVWACTRGGCVCVCVCVCVHMNTHTAKNALFSPHLTDEQTCVGGAKIQESTPNQCLSPTYQAGAAHPTACLAGSSPKK